MAPTQQLAPFRSNPSFFYAPPPPILSIYLVPPTCMTDDEDICSNPFFTALLSANRALLSEAAAKGALLCVPKTGTCPVESMRQLDYRSHVISQSPFFVGMYDSLDSRQVTCVLSHAAPHLAYVCCSCR
jgi:hypothetical protein